MGKIITLPVAANNEGDDAPASSQDQGAAFQEGYKDARSLLASRGPEYICEAYVHTLEMIKQYAEGDKSIRINPHLHFARQVESLMYQMLRTYSPKHYVTRIEMEKALKNESLFSYIMVHQWAADERQSVLVAKRAYDKIFRFLDEAIHSNKELMWGLNGQWEGMIPIVTDCVRLPQWRFEKSVIMDEKALDSMFTDENIGIMHVHPGDLTIQSIDDMQTADDFLRRSKRDHYLSAIISMRHAHISWYVWGKYYCGCRKLSGEQTRIELPDKSIIEWGQAC